MRPEWCQLPFSAAAPCSLPLVDMGRMVCPTYLASSEHGHWNSYLPGFADGSYLLVLELQRMSLSFVPDLETRFMPACAFELVVGRHWYVWDADVWLILPMTKL